jgi:hypothetical protein
MSNAACKLFCDAHTHHGLDPTGGIPPQRPLDVEVAKRRMSQCLVGLQEDWEGTKRLLRRWAPWLGIDDKVRENTGNWGAENAHELRPELRELILAYNQCDVELYRHARTLFARQMALLE